MESKVSKNIRPETDTPAEPEAEIVVNGAPRPLGAISTVADLVTDLGWSDRPCAVELNRRVVSRADHGETRIVAGDRVEIVTLVGGG
jgi:sulfur carrier protein